MSTPTAQGKLLVASKAPVFAGYVIVDGTWKEKPNAVGLLTKDTTAGTVNASWSDGGWDAQCDIIPCSGDDGVGGSTSPLLVQGQVITETTAGATGTIRTWLIFEAPETTPKFGEPMKQSVKFMSKDALMAAITAG